MKGLNIKKLYLIILTSFSFLSCVKSDCDQIITNNLGVIQFRRSYANHLHMSDSAFDSLVKSNPEFDNFLNGAKPELHQYLEKFGFSFKNKLLINKLDTLLHDTLLISKTNGAKYSLFPTLDIKTKKTFLTILGKNCQDSIYLDQTPSPPRFRFINFEPENKKFILVYWQYYFMNGDMFDIALFETH